MVSISIVFSNDRKKTLRKFLKNSNLRGFLSYVKVKDVRGFPLQLNIKSLYSDVPQSISIFLIIQLVIIATVLNYDFIIFKI